LREVKEKYNYETFTELISKEEPEKIIKIIKKFREKSDNNDKEVDYSQNHQ